MEENKEVLELLKQIEKSNRQQVRSTRLMCIFALIAALCCVVTFVTIFSFVPQINSILPKVDTAVTQMQTVLGNLEQTTEQLASVDLEGMVTDVDALVVSGQQSLEQTMEKLENIDLDTLNQAIKDLSSVIEPLAKFANMFK